MTTTTVPIGENGTSGNDVTNGSGLEPGTPVDDAMSTTMPFMQDESDLLAEAGTSGDDFTDELGYIAVVAALALILVCLVGYSREKRKAKGAADITVENQAHTTADLRTAASFESTEKKTVTSAKVDTDVDVEAARHTTAASETLPRPLAYIRDGPTENGQPEPIDPDDVTPVTKMTVASFNDEQFIALPQNAADLDQLPGNPADLMKYNRYRNILPNALTRVALSQKGSDTTSTYINANFITDAYGNPKGYIASQGPKPETAGHFWRLVWEQDSRAIVMITGLVESGREKCHRYWPDSNVKSEVYGDFFVTTKSTFEGPIFTETTLTLSMAGASGETREVKHFWYTDWPDHGVPTGTAGAVSMLAAVRECSDEPKQPWVVHCSAGVGRTGTFIGIDTGILQLNHTGKADVLELVKLMRSCRGQMVQSLPQARFIHAVLHTFAEKFNSNSTEEAAEAEVPNGPADSDAITAADLGSMVDTQGWGQARLRFFGFNVRTYKLMVGVEFPYVVDGSGNDGALDGHRYFSCRADCGMFFEPSEVKKTDAEDYPDSDRGSIASLEDLVEAAGVPSGVDSRLLKHDPLWLHAPTPREASDALLLHDPVAPGDFFVKRRHEDNTFELAVVSLDGSVSHHKINRSQGDGHAMQVTLAHGEPVDFPECASLNELIKTLANRHRHWPVPLCMYVPRTARPGKPVVKAAYITSTRPEHAARARSLIEPVDGMASGEFPAFPALSRTEVDAMLNYLGGAEGRWLLRRLDATTACIGLYHKGSTSHHKIELEDGMLWLNEEAVGECTLVDLLNTLQVAPTLLSWPVKLSKKRFVRPRSVGEVVSAPSSTDGRHYDGVIVAMVPAGTFAGIDVAMARVSYSGQPTDSDDCVPLAGLGPRTKLTHPDYYTGGALTGYGPVQTTDDPATMPAGESAAALMATDHRVSITVQGGSSLGMKLINLGWGNYVCELSPDGLVCATGLVQVGMKVVGLNRNDVTGLPQDNLVEAIATARDDGPSELSFQVDRAGWAAVKTDAAWAAGATASISVSPPRSPAKSGVGTNSGSGTLRADTVFLKAFMSLDGDGDAGTTLNRAELDSRLSKEFLAAELPELVDQLEVDGRSTVEAVLDQAGASPDGCISVTDFIAVVRKRMASDAAAPSAKGLTRGRHGSGMDLVAAGGLAGGAGASASNPRELAIGDRVTTRTRGAGTVRFVGAHRSEGTPRVGVELDGPTGLNNGTVRDHVYFTCANGHGILTKPDNVEPIVRKKKKKKKKKKKAQKSLQRAFGSAGTVTVTVTVTIKRASKKASYGFAVGATGPAADGYNPTSKDEHSVVTDIVKGSPASFTDLQIGDRIMAVNGDDVPANRLSYENIIARIAAGGVVVLTVSRPGPVSASP